MNPDSPWLRGGVVLVVAFVVHEALLRGFRIDGIRPDLLMGVGLAAGTVAGRERAAVFAFAGALLGDLFVNTPFGLSALVACVVAYAIGTVQASLGAHHRWTTPVLVAIGSLVAEIVWALLGTVLGLPGLMRPRLLVIAGVVATVNAALSIPLTPVLRWAFVADVPLKPGATARGFAA